MNNLTMGMYKPTQKQITAFAIVSFVIVAAFTILLTVCPALMDTVYAEPGFVGNIKTSLTGGDGLLGLVQGIANPIAAVAIAACALYMLMGSDPTTLRKVKTWMLCIIAGLIVVNLADDIATWAANLGASTGGGK